MTNTVKRKPVDVRDSYLGAMWIGVENDDFVTVALLAVEAGEKYPRCSKGKWSRLATIIAELARDMETSVREKRHFVMQNLIYMNYAK